jgi:7-cyano-7-deazaguanine synthase in queuosine biosynthesis
MIQAPNVKETQKYDFRLIKHDLENYFWVDDSCLTKAFGQSLTCRPADLIDLAMAVYYADRKTVRPHSDMSRTGQRIYNVCLPVNDLQFWKRNDVCQNLSELLYWFTDDIWTFDFVPKMKPTILNEQVFLFKSPPMKPNIVSLFSGGLDSLAGIYIQMATHPENSFILVSGFTNPRLRTIQADLVKELRRNWPNRQTEIRHVVIPFGISGLKEKTREENSQRTRGFVFLAFGAATANMTLNKSLFLYENGIGSINLPYNESQLGVDNSRNVHPISLIKMSKFLSMVFDDSFEIVNPFQFQTKGQMVAQIKNLEGAINSIPRTISCDSFPLRIANAPAQCGLCTSCLLRRSALNFSGLVDLDNSKYYLRDITALAVENCDEKLLYPFWAMSDQVDKLNKILVSKSPWLSLQREFPEVREIQEQMKYSMAPMAPMAPIAPPMASLKIQESIVKMYQAYVLEWQDFTKQLI